MSRKYSGEFNNVAVSAAQDLFELLTPATCSVKIAGWIVAQHTDYGDGQAEGKRLQVIKGNTTTGSGGTTVTPAQLDNSGASACTVKANNTTVATAGTVVNLVSHGWNVQATDVFWFTPEYMPEIPPSTRVVLRMPDAPTDVFTASGTLFWEEN